MLQYLIAIVNTILKKDQVKLLDYISFHSSDPLFLITGLKKRFLASLYQTDFKTVSWFVLLDLLEN